MGLPSFFYKAKHNIILFSLNWIIFFFFFTDFPGNYFIFLNNHPPWLPNGWPQRRLWLVFCFQINFYFLIYCFQYLESQAIIALIVIDKFFEYCILLINIYINAKNSNCMVQKSFYFCINNSGLCKFKNMYVKWGCYRIDIYI